MKLRYTIIAVALIIIGFIIFILPNNKSSSFESGYQKRVNIIEDLYLEKSVSFIMKIIDKDSIVSYRDYYCFLYYSEDCGNCIKDAINISDELVFNAGINFITTISTSPRSYRSNCYIDSSFVINRMMDNLFSPIFLIVDKNWLLQFFYISDSNIDDNINKGVKNILGFIN